MPLIQTEFLSQTNLPKSQFELNQIYNGLDCCLTLEILEELLRIHQNKDYWKPIYTFERALQAPYLEIMQRGFKIDQLARSKASADLNERIVNLRTMLDEFAIAASGKSLNPRSYKQLNEFFFNDMRLPKNYQSKKGELKLSLDREALEKLLIYLHARPFINLILLIRDLYKQLQIFEAEIDKDGRFRASYNIAGTETGRASSSKSSLGTGGNAQNIAPGCRYPFIPDKGMKLCVIDLEQVEAREVGFICGCLFDDWTYLNACESGDLHTNNCKLIWPELPWTGDKTLDRKIADGSFYRDFSRRDMAKRGGHLTSYYGTPWTMARSLKIPIEKAEDFQQRFCKGKNCAYPVIPRWWQWTAEKLQTTGVLTNLFGRQRRFFGRPGDDTTLREAIAFVPQGSTADRINLGLWRIWKYLPQAQLLAQVHDAVVFQFPEELEDWIIPQALNFLKVELTSPSGRKYVVPGEAKVGYNWGAKITPEMAKQELAKTGKKLTINPFGLVKWKAKP